MCISAVHYGASGKGYFRNGISSTDDSIYSAANVFLFCTAISYLFHAPLKLGQNHGDLVWIVNVDIYQSQLTMVLSSTNIPFSFIRDPVGCIIKKKL